MKNPPKRNLVTERLRGKRSFPGAHQQVDRKVRGASWLEGVGGGEFTLMGDSAVGWFQPKGTDGDTGFRIARTKK